MNDFRNSSIHRKRRNNNRNHNSRKEKPWSRSPRLVRPPPQKREYDNRNRDRVPELPRHLPRVEVNRRPPSHLFRGEIEGGVLLRFTLFHPASITNLTIFL